MDFGINNFYKPRFMNHGIYVIFSIRISRQCGNIQYIPPLRHATTRLTSLLSLSPSDLGLETGRDGADGRTGLTGLAVQEVDSVFLVEEGIGGFAGLARYVFHCERIKTVRFGGESVRGGSAKRQVNSGELTDVSTQNVFDLFLLETTLDDQTPGAVYTTSSSQFGKDERDDVFRLSTSTQIAPQHRTAHQKTGSAIGDR